MRQLLLAPLAFLALAFAGCSSDDKPATVLHPAIHIEPSEKGSWGAREVVMPQTGLHFEVLNRPVIPEGNFIMAEVYEVGPPELRRNVIGIEVDGKGAEALYSLSTKAPGKRLFLMVNDAPVGVHRVGDALNRGVLFDVEVPGATKAEKDKATFKLRDDLNEAILKIRKEKAAK